MFSMKFTTWCDYDSDSNCDKKAIGMLQMSNRKEAVYILCDSYIYATSSCNLVLAVALSDQIMTLTWRDLIFKEMLLIAIFDTSVSLPQSLWLLHHVDFVGA